MDQDKSYIMIHDAHHDEKTRQFWNQRFTFFEENFEQNRLIPEVVKYLRDANLHVKNATPFCLLDKAMMFGDADNFPKLLKFMQDVLFIKAKFNMDMTRLSTTTVNALLIRNPDTEPQEKSLQDYVVHLSFMRPLGFTKITAQFQIYPQSESDALLIPRQ
jgi:hypothetical protein